MDSQKYDIIGFWVCTQALPAFHICQTLAEGDIGAQLTFTAAQN